MSDDERISLILSECEGALTRGLGICQKSWGVGWNRDWGWHTTPPELSHLVTTRKYRAGYRVGQEVAAVLFVAE